ncbi:cellulose-binding beta-glucosidase [Coprinopsis marcescibilis]|uniref:beta-glucosidase n=1 Tax=Coprinopsis marcescibilis TaxID=230819 RepID=A0A5C3LC35_COPMA|nr:cellulose-binding beta-glucosidase [Coprinopsis marcescibilis]
MLVRERLLVIVLAATLVAAQQPLYGQCGGRGWSGSTECVSGAVCTRVNDFYSQCLPGSGTAPPVSTTTPAPPVSTSTSVPPTTPTNPPSNAPIPNMSPEWQAAWVKAQAAVARMSVADKVNLGTGIQWQKGACVGNIAPIQSINFPGLCLQDGPLGVRFADLVSVFPAAINAASTFNRTLIRRRAEQLGAEMRGKGINVALAPAMNVQRAPAGGRNWEGFGADPYLNGEASYETIIGIQSQGVQATAKHYINNEQEHFRESSSSVVDDRNTKYTHTRVQANVAAMMCSYINGTYACENDKVLNGLLKGEFGFPGCELVGYRKYNLFRRSDSCLNKLYSTRPRPLSTLVSILGSGTTYFGQTLIRSVDSGQVSRPRLDDLATRILAAWYLTKQESGFPSPNFNSWNVNSPPAQHVNVQRDHKENIRLIGAASTVLLKNVGNILPLKDPRSIGIIGNGAGPNSRGINGCSDRGCNDGVLAQGWGSGTAEYPYLSNPLDAITARARTYGGTVSSSLSDTNLNAAQTTASGKDVAIFVYSTADSGEGYITVEGNAGDRNDLKAWHGGDALVQRVATSNTKTIVVVNTVGPIEMEPWINNPNGLGWSSWTRSSGRLPYTIGKTINDYGTKVLYNSNVQIPTINYSEGLFIDYRHFDKQNIEPRYEFGFGLSYTTFGYSDLKVTGTAGGVTFGTGKGSSLAPALHEKTVTVTFTLTNTGSVAGHEIPQLYIGLPAETNSPPKSLKGFDSVFLQPNQSKTVTLQLSRFDLAIWDTPNGRWRVPSGVTSILIGASSRDIRLSGSVTN